MAPLLKKRNIIDSTASRLPFQNAINSYGKITKPSQHFTIVKQHERQLLKPPLHVDPSCSEQPGSKKRRREIEVDTPAKRERLEESPRKQVIPKHKATKLEGPVSPGETESKGPSSLPAPTTPIKRKEPLRPKSRKLGTPTQGARAILEAFVIGDPSDACQRDPNPRVDRPCSPEGIDGLPALNEAFLKTFSLHLAHHGSSSPAELRQLLPSIERVWQRRRVEAVDVRRVLGVLQYRSSRQEHSPSLNIADYGNGKLCIEYETSTNAPLPVDVLRKTFAANFDELRPKRSDASLADLPLAPIVPANPSDTTSRGPSKGAQRLFDIKSLARAAQPSELPTPPSSAAGCSTPSTPTKSQPASRASALLERIRAKEAHAATLPAPPSAEATARRSALMRMQEVIPVIDLLAAGKLQSAPAGAAMSSANALAALMGGRSGGLDGAASGGCTPATASFTMASMTQHVQNSLRNPISGEEAERCVRLAASEVVAGWMTIREIGKVVGVVVRGRIGRGAWTARVEDLLGEA